MKELSVDEIILEITKMRRSGEVYPDGLFVAEVGGELSKANYSAVKTDSDDFSAAGQPSDTAESYVGVAYDTGTISVVDRVTARTIPIDTSLFSETVSVSEREISSRAAPVDTVRSVDRAEAVSGLPSSDYESVRAVPSPDYESVRAVPSPDYESVRAVPSPDYESMRAVPSPDYESVRIEGGFESNDYDSIVRKWKKSERGGITITDVDLPVIRDKDIYGGYDGGVYDLAEGVYDSRAVHGERDLYRSAEGGTVTAVHAAHAASDDYSGGGNDGRRDTLTKPLAFAAADTVETISASADMLFEELNPLENGSDSAAVRNTKDFDNDAIKPVTQPLSLIPGTITEEITAASELKRKRGEKRRRGSTGLIESVISRKAGHLPSTNKFSAVGQSRRRADKDVKLNINYKRQVVHTGDVPEITLTDTDTDISDTGEQPKHGGGSLQRAANKKLANRILNGGTVPTGGIGGTGTYTADLDNTAVMNNGDNEKVYGNSGTAPDGIDLTETGSDFDEAETEFFTPDTDTGKVNKAESTAPGEQSGDKKAKHRAKPKHDDDKAVSDTLDEMYREISFKSVIMGIITALLFAVEIYNTVVRPVFGVQVSLSVLSFADKIINPVGYILFNIILGVIAAVLCHGVFMCLFRPNRGGERLTALIIVAAVLAAVPAVAHFDLVQRGFAFIYIPAAVFLLFCDTLKKRGTILTMKRNFRLVYGETAKYYGFCVTDTETARLLTKGFDDIHVPNVVTMRRTAYLTHFLNNGFSPDVTDTHGNKHAAFSFVLAVLAGVTAHFAPFVPPELRHDLVYSASVFAAAFTASMPVLLMFSVCSPLKRGSDELLQYKAMVGGYSAAETFSKVNVAALDAVLLFPNDTIRLESVKPYTTRNGLNDVSLNEAMIIAASVAIQSGSVMTNMFDEIINGDRSVLRRIDEIIYEENMGVTGWAEQRRVFFGNDLLMKRHEINVPSVEALRRGKKEKRNNMEIVYLALGGDVVAAFALKITANVEVAESLRRLQRNNIAVAVRTGDSIVTSAQLAHMFNLNDSLVRVISFNAHSRFRSTSKYTTTGNCGIVCDGSLSSFAAGIAASKLLLRDIHRTGGFAYFAAAVGIAVFSLCALIQADMGVSTSAGLAVYNIGCAALAGIASAGRRYLQ